jgi:glutamate N-acetyltransferase / amino-acid N-acetyltransferase
MMSGERHTDPDHAAEIARKQAEITRLEAEIAAHRKALGQGLAPSPFAPERFPDLPRVAGLRFAAGVAGVRYKSGRTDVMLAELAPGSVMAGALTRSGTRSAPVLWCGERLKVLADRPPTERLAVVVNAGNANAFTGRHGRAAVEHVTGACGEALGIPAGNVFMASTGVIGEPLPSERITAKLAELCAGLSPDAIEDAARAIVTTDTYPKGAGATVELEGTTAAIAGFAKGSGMIAPDMATMLAFVFTDAAIAQPLLQRTVSELTDETFNTTTVDGDTSTSDTLLVGATGGTAMPQIEDAADPRYPGFRAALHRVMHDLAIQVVKDGEGATKVAAITVRSAESDRAARRIGLAIANSPLVKTALAGEDANWGRIVMAVGKSGEKADRDRLAIRFGDILVAEAGWVAGGYSESQGAAYMKRAELEISVDVGIGDGRATVWTCDLTHGYISINADYRS